MSDFEFEIPGPKPSVNHMYLPTATIGRLRKAPGVEVWQTGVAYIVRLARPSGWMPARRTVIEVEWYTQRWADSDNGFKALADAIAAGLGCDDKGFLLRAMVNEVDKVNPRTIVRVTNAPDA